MIILTSKHVDYYNIYPFHHVSQSSIQTFDKFEHLNSYNNKLILLYGLRTVDFPKS